MLKPRPQLTNHYQKDDNTKSMPLLHAGCVPSTALQLTCDASAGFTTAQVWVSDGLLHRVTSFAVR